MDYQPKYQAMYQPEGRACRADTKADTKGWGEVGWQSATLAAGPARGH